LDLYVQPASAEVTIDGQRWVSSAEGHFMVQVPVGKHRVDVSQSGYRRFTTEVEVGDGQTIPLNVSLITTTSPRGGTAGVPTTCLVTWRLSSCPGRPIGSAEQLPGPSGGPLDIGDCNRSTRAAPFL
jgi:hypothetical protein